MVRNIGFYNTSVNLVINKVIYKYMINNCCRVTCNSCGFINNDEIEEQFANSLRIFKLCL